MGTNVSPQTQITTSDVDPTIATTATPNAPAPSAAPVPLANAQATAPEAIVDRGDPDVPNETTEQTMGVGTDGETNIWEARYAMKNFLGRLIGMGVLSLAWMSLAIYAWGYREQAGSGLNVLAIVAGITLGVMWLALLRRIVLARLGHSYRLTNRRLFVSTGLFNRRRDQMELLQVQDVYTKQSFSQRLLSLGTVVVVSRDQHFPVMYLTGVEDPKSVMDLIWHHARAERDRRSMKVDTV